MLEQYRLNQANDKPIVALDRPSIRAWLHLPCNFLQATFSQLISSQLFLDLFYNRDRPFYLRVSPRFDRKQETAERRRYCSEPPCQQASKLARQRRWLRKNGDGDYFRGPRAVERVQAWRKLYPGYSRMMYLEFTLSESMEQFRDCHRHAFEFLGSVPAQIMIDNHKVGVLSQVKSGFWDTVATMKQRFSPRARRMSI